MNHSTHNQQVREKYNTYRKPNYALRKLSIGVASVLLSMTVLNLESITHACTVTNTVNQQQTPPSANPTSAVQNKPESTTTVTTRINPRDQDKATITTLSVSGQPETDKVVTHWKNNNLPAGYQLANEASLPTTVNLGTTDRTLPSLQLSHIVRPATDDELKTLYGDNKSNWNKGYLQRNFIIVTNTAKWIKNLSDSSLGDPDIYCGRIYQLLSYTWDTYYDEESHTFIFKNYHAISGKTLTLYGSQNLQDFKLLKILEQTDTITMADIFNNPRLAKYIKTTGSDLEAITIKDIPGFDTPNYQYETEGSANPTIHYCTFGQAIDANISTQLSNYFATIKASDFSLDKILSTGSNPQTVLQDYFQSFIINYWPNPQNKVRLNPFDKATVKDPGHLTNDEEGQVVTNIKKTNEDKHISTIEVGDDGNTTLTFEDGTKLELTPDQTIIAYKSGDPLINTGDADADLNPFDNTPVKDPTLLTDDEKGQVQTNIKKTNSGKHIATIDVKYNGRTIITFEDGTQKELTPDETITQLPADKPVAATVTPEEQSTTPGKTAPTSENDQQSAVVIGTSTTKPVANQSSAQQQKQQRLPQTGDNHEAAVAGLGLAVAMMSMFGLKKRRED